MNIRNKIFKNNKDLLERFDSAKVDFSYIKGDDVYLVNIKTSKFMDSIDLFDGLIIAHYDPSTYKIMGFTLPYVKEFKEVTQKLLKEKEMENIKEKKEKVKVNRIASASLFGLSPAF